MLMRITSYTFPCAAIAMGIFLVADANAASAYLEQWNAGDTNGWIQSTTSSVVVRDVADGNPAASLAVRRSLSPPVFDMGVTTELTALSDDYTGQPAWMLSFDAKHDIGNYTDMWLRFRYQDATFNGWYLDIADVFPNSWESYSVTFNPAWSDAQAMANGWTDETGGAVSWQTLMTDVYHPEIRFLLGDNQSAVAHVDNVQLKVVPEPRSTTLPLLATLGMLGLSTRRRRPW